MYAFYDPLPLRTHLTHQTLPLPTHNGIFLKQQINKSIEKETEGPFHKVSHPHKFILNNHTSPLINSFLVYYNILYLPLTNNQHTSIIQNSTILSRRKRKISFCPFRNVLNGPRAFQTQENDHSKCFIKKAIKFVANNKNLWWNYLAYENLDVSTPSTLVRMAYAIVRPSLPLRAYVLN